MPPSTANAPEIWFTDGPTDVRGRVGKTLAILSGRSEDAIWLVSRVAVASTGKGRAADELPGRPAGMLINALYVVQQEGRGLRLPDELLSMASGGPAEDAGLGAGSLVGVEGAPIYAGRWELGDYAGLVTVWQENWLTVIGPNLPEVVSLRPYSGYQVQA